MSGYSGSHMTSWTAWVRFVGYESATPSATAASTTASATIADDGRSFCTAGSSGVLACDTSACSATAAAAALSMCGVTLEALETVTPRPRPGTTRKDVACPIVNVLLLSPEGLTVLPVATSACASDQAMTSEGVASAVEAGPETGMINGRLVARHMASMTCLVNAPSTAQVPSRLRGAAS